MRVWLFALIPSACGFSGSLGNDAAPGPEVDGAVVAIDAADGPGSASDAADVDTRPEPICVGTFLRVCVDPPQAALTLSTQRIDTGSSPMCASYTSTPAIDACVITGAQLVIPDDIVVTVVRVAGDKVRLGIEAPPDVVVLRDELQPFGPLSAASAAGRISASATGSPANSN